MKKSLLFILAIAAAVCFFSRDLAAQRVTVDKSGNYVAVKTNADTVGKATGKTFTDTKGNVFPVYASKSGKLYVLRTSKSGNVYKQYLKLD